MEMWVIFTLPAAVPLESPDSRYRRPTTSNALKESIQISLGLSRGGKDLPCKGQGKENDSSSVPRKVQTAQFFE
jgi:hypothetical protein